MCYTYTIAFYSALKKNEISLLEGKYIELSCYATTTTIIIISRSRKINSDFSFMCKLDFGQKDVEVEYELFK